MAYLSIENLYRSKAQEILLFKELYVLKESTGEIVDSKEVRNAINKKTVELFKKKVNVIKG